MSKSAHATMFAIHTFAYMLLGYALAGPVRLSFYFYSKPFWDLLIDGLLIIAAVTLSFKWIGAKAKPLIILIPFLALSWMRIEFVLFSKAEIFAIFSYLFITLWGMSFVSIWKLFDKEEDKGKKWGRCLLAISGGVLLGFVNGVHLVIPFMALAFIICLIIIYPGNTKMRRGVAQAGLSVLSIILVIGLEWALPDPHFYKSQSKFHDKVVYSHTTPFQRIDVTEWKGNHWFYQDGINQFSSIDSWLYFEPFAHPAMQLVEPGARVLVVGGENGMLARELLKYEGVMVELIPVDREYLKLSKELSYLKEQHGEVFTETSIHILEGSVFQTLNKSNKAYDVIFVDVPDPIDIELNRYFTKEFYELCHLVLKDKGLLVTQSGSPYFATSAFQSIQKTIGAADFDVVAYHNQVLTLGEWAWTIGAKSGLETDVKSALKRLAFDGIETEWLNNEAMQMMLSFGKAYVTSDDVSINTIKEPVIHQYYNRGNYQLQ